VFPYALYDEIVAAWKQDVIFDKGLLHKMLAAIEGAVEIGARLAPRAHRASADAVGGDRAKLQLLFEAQERNLTALQGLLKAMRGWHNLQDLKLRLRGIIEEQEVVIRRQDESAGGPDDGAKPDAKKDDKNKGGNSRR